MNDICCCCAAVPSCPGKRCQVLMRHLLAIAGLTSKLETGSEGIEHIQEELVILPEEVPNRLL